MVELQEQAFQKMLKEMEKSNNQMEERVHNWLCKQEDSELFKGILQEGKSIKSAIEYCSTQAYRLQVGSCVFIEDETVYGWVVEYFKMPVVAKKEPKKKRKAVAYEPKFKPQPKAPTSGA